MGGDNQEDVPSDRMSAGVLVGKVDEQVESFDEGV